MPDLGDLGNAAEDVKDFVVEKGTSALKAGASVAGKAAGTAKSMATSAGNAAKSMATEVAETVVGDGEETGVDDYQDSSSD